MKFVLSIFAIVASCLLLIGASAEEASTSPRPVRPLFPIAPLAAEGFGDFGNNPAARLFFFNSNSDPCNNNLYNILNIRDLKCSFQCYTQAGTQNGGYCDDDNVCQCNVVE